MLEALCADSGIDAVVARDGLTITVEPSQADLPGTRPAVAGQR
jgi:hypothetical protein